MSLRARRTPPTAAAARGSSGGIGRKTSPHAEQVSDDLRLGGGPLLTRRRRIAALSLGATGSLVAVTAYQLGLVRHLPEPPGGVFDADKVDASGEAYQLFGTPDAPLALASYAITLALAGMGTRRRAQEQPWVPLALAAKVGLDVASGLYLTAEQVTKHRKVCTWCLGTTAASLAMLPQALPEARQALGHLAGRR